MPGFENAEWKDGLKSVEAERFEGVTRPELIARLEGLDETKLAKLESMLSRSGFALADLESLNLSDVTLHLDALKNSDGDEERMNLEALHSILSESESDFDDKDLPQAA